MHNRTAIRKPGGAAAALMLVGIGLAGCATIHSTEERWTAYAFPTPEHSDDPDYIGVYPTKADCENALAAWRRENEDRAQQIEAQCYPEDRD